MILVYTEIISSRLQYILDFIGKEMGGADFQFTNDKERFQKFNTTKLNYSNKRNSDVEYWIKPNGLLFEKGIQPKKTDCFVVNGQKAFFKTEGDFPFDILSASFYLLSRYEEYLPYKKDMYGRYAHENSLAFQENFLQLPLINIWLKDLAASLKNKFSSFTFHLSPFTFRPTYDIDEAYSYKHKGLARTAGGFAKQLLTGNWGDANTRIAVLNNKAIDPYDSFLWMDKLHTENTMHPIYFFQIAHKRGEYDKNILPSHPAMKQLIQQLSEKYTVGIHPSWRSGDEENLLPEEIQNLEHITGKKITISRQHYLRFTLPHTFRRLIDAGITDDHSMAYGTINGFRASVASSFYWYDLEKEEKTNLLLHPFCFMEANSFFEQKLTPEQTLEEMQHYYNEVKSVNGTLITLWHNSFLGTEKRFAGLKEVYEQFSKQVRSEM